MLVSEVMTPFPAFVRLGTEIGRAVEVLSASEVGQLVVVDHQGQFVGTLSEEDVVRAVLPRFDEVADRGGSLDDAFAVLLERGRGLADRVVDPLVVREGPTVAPRDHVARAAVVMLDRGLRRLPVVDGGTLVGTLSRSALCRAVVFHA